MKKILQRLKVFLYVVLSGFLGVFGLANLAPNSTVGQITGQSVSQQAQNVNSSKQNSQKPVSQVSQMINAIRREPDPFVGNGKSTKVWKPQPMKRKKHTNLLKCSAKAKRKRKKNRR